jgi:hypothetical protein
MTRSVTKRQEAYEAGLLVVAGDRAVGNSRGTIIATTGAAPTPRAPNELSVRELFERFRLENEIGFEWAWKSSGFARRPAADLGPGRSPLAAAAERIASAGQRLQAVRRVAFTLHARRSSLACCCVSIVQLSPGPGAAGVSAKASSDDPTRPHLHALQRRYSSPQSPDRVEGVV